MNVCQTGQGTKDLSSKSAVDTTILRIPKERDSLHKFAIREMLGISDDEAERPKSQSRSESEVTKLDENCNNLAGKERKSPVATSSRNSSPHNVSMSSPSLPGEQHERLVNCRTQSSPLGFPPPPPYDFPWPGPLFRGMAPHFSPYLPFGMPIPGFTPGFPPLHPVTSEHQFPLKALSDPFLAFNAMRHAFPQSRSLASAHLPYPKPVSKSLKTDSVEENDSKVLTSAFDPVVSKYSPLRESSMFELDLSVSGKRKERDGETMRYHCDGCTKVYATFSGLTKHKQFHCASQVKKEFSCKYCDKTYVSLGALKMHIRTHTLPCKCKLCGKAFSRPWLLQGHIRTHTGEKPFRCDHCARAFADRSNLRAHLQTHSDIKKYSCKSCCKTFSRMSLLLKHEDGCCSKPLLV
ncbi:zinc finger protein SNAI3-like [Saccostrea echinata]|uniref:zinc finger protein SNAI3-like n=1 Tax=Saccostrea echinata TaxID=191078 RepID=UPI002A840F4B|nr:zinc finger protein SNAI3-like [Saccostrea echinata]